MIDFEIFVILRHLFHFAMFEISNRIFDITVHVYETL